jgi:flagellar basal body rod protein FlgC
MIRGLGTPVSGLTAATERHAATAVNVAQVNVKDAKRARVDLAPQAVTAGVSSNHRIMDPAGSGLVDDMADMSITHGLYTANAAVIRAQDETTRSVLDIFA